MRHVKIRTVLAAQNPPLIPMIQEAWGNGVKAYAYRNDAGRKRRERLAER
jgi:hypothetical protein